MRTIALLLVGVAVGWTASGVEWTPAAVGQDGAIAVESAIEAEAIAAPSVAVQPANDPAGDGERSIRRQRDGVLRRRGILPSRETPPAANAPSEAPAFAPASETPSSAEAMPYSRPGAELVPPLDDPEAMRGPALMPAGPVAPAAGRFQLSAFNTASQYGYYIVDTATGRVWYGLQGSTPRLVVDKLPER